MEGKSKSKGFLILLLRGLLGGMVGGLAFAAVEVCLIRPNGWDNWIGWGLIIFLSVGLPFGVIVGTALGGAVWIFYHYSRIELGLLARGTVGTVIGIAFCAMAWSRNNGEGYARNPFLIDLIGLVLMGLAFGGIPGLLIGTQRTSEASRVDPVVERAAQP